MTKKLYPRVLPIAYVVLFVVVMLGVSILFPTYRFEIRYTIPISIIIFISGVMIVLAGGFQFRQAATTINPLTPDKSSALVTSGLYKYSRNPMYVGFFLFLVAWSVYLGNIFSFLLLPFFIFLINVRQIYPEEKILEKLFGDEYREYSRKTRRWI